MVGTSPYTTGVLMYKYDVLVSRRQMMASGSIEQDRFLLLFASLGYCTLKRLKHMLSRDRGIEKHFHHSTKAAAFNGHLHGNRSEI